MRKTSKRIKIQVGDWVQVRSKQEILSTLDAKGELEGMPFMPEMLKYCGMNFKVYKQAHKTCDYSTQHPHRSRWLKDAVHLETRCGGEAHDGCQAGCLIYWKTAWLKPLHPDINPTALASVPGNLDEPGKRNVHCDESLLYERTRYIDNSDGSLTYRCQTTQVPHATRTLYWWDLRQYIVDVRSGNISLGRLMSGAIYSAYFHTSNSGIGVGPAMRWFYNRICWIWGGTMFPRSPGHIPRGSPTPAKALNLQPGELVRIKSHEEILNTVDVDNKNRGMYWDAELVPYCGKEYRVLSRVKRLIDEKTSKMIEMKNPCIILDKVVCQARYSQCRMFCPREMYPYWREVWLDRVEPSREGEPADEQRDPKSEHVENAVPCGS